MFIGFDYGTANCSVAVMRDGKPQLLKMENDSTLLPSMLCAPTREAVSEWLYRHHDVPADDDETQALLRRAIRYNREEDIDVTAKSVQFGLSSLAQYIDDPVGPLLGPALGGLLVEYASWHWIFLINIPVGIIGAIATLLLMPNYTMQTRRFDLSGFLLLAVGMAVLTLALDGSKGTGLSPLTIAGLVAVGVVALVLYLLHARNNNRALFSLKLFRTRTFSLGLAGSFAGRIGSGMLPFMTPVFLQIGLGFSPFHAGLMMIPMVLGSMGMKRIVVQVVNRFGYRRVLVATTLGLSLVTLLFMTTALLGWYYVLPFVLFLQGMVNSTRFSSMNTLTLKDLPDNLASSGNSLLSMIMQLSMSIGVTIAGLLLGLFGSQHVSVDSGTTQTVFMYTWLSMALIIALPAFIFARVPNDTHQNVAISRRKRSAQ
ncbi:multidrug transporter subunit MdtD [Escherichia coli]|uniref:multidrug transporter subunit MdtD n=1 Tax=Escherichia coli TaxID=562 RepID=UPI0027DE49E0|nr:multidrug transporter subunit MdtD [Escherichia coli]